MAGWNFRSKTSDPLCALKMDALSAAAQLSWGVELDDSLAFAEPELAAFYNLWRLKQVSRDALPERADLDPKLLKPFLRHITLMERVPGADGAPHFRFRLQGSALTQNFGEQTGKLLEEVMPPEVARAWTLINEALITARRPMRILSRHKVPRIEFITGESFAVALGNGGKNPVTILSATYFQQRRKAL